VSIDPIVAGLQAYVVGGAVRDALLGLPHGDRDWVIVGSTPEEMAKRGFIPVGGDFPVFLHPQTKEEYALARTERKSGRGYKGFTFYTGVDVTIEEDLRRRDLTVNAIAQAATGELIDPMNGQADLKARVFRHVGEAFKEDPVRILRLARFAARFVDFTVAPETMALCQAMVAEGEVDALVPERVWQELARGLLCVQPSRMMQVLDDAGVLPRVMPQWRSSEVVLSAIDSAMAHTLPLEARYALFCLNTEDRAGLSRHLRAPGDCADMARLLPVVLEACQAEQNAESVLGLFEVCDALRKPDRLRALLRTAAVVAVVNIEQWEGRLMCVLDVDAGQAAQQASHPSEIKAAVRQARLNALVALI
jgi:tRNA nucleotidyltransferase (CCA-adding enzyme)